MDRSGGLAHRPAAGAAVTGGSRRVRITAGRNAYAVDVPPAGPLTVEGAAGPVAVTRLDETTFEVLVAERRLAVQVVESRGRYRVFADGCTFNFEVEPPGRGAAVAADDSGGESVLASPMPATVVTVHVAPGQTVRRDDTLVVLEAMKMELSVRSPRDGVVESVSCRQGELVQPGVPLVALRRDPA